MEGRLFYMGDAITHLPAGPVILNKVKNLGACSK